MTIKHLPMRLYFTTVLLFTASFLAAQPIIESSDLVSGPGSFNVVDALGASSDVYEVAGANQTWDFSDLQALNPTTIDYVSVSGAPFGYQFFFNSPFTPNYQATHAIEGEGIDLVAVTIDEFFFFYKNTPTQYNIVGYGGTVNGIPLPAQTNPIDVVYALPVEYGNTHSSYSEWGIEIPTVGTYRQRQNRSYEVEGYGTVITPEGSFEALKLRVELQTEDSLYVDFIQQGLTFQRESIVYTWLAEGEGVPVLEITETFGQTTVRYKAATPIGIAEAAHPSGIQLWPTLCSEGFWVDGLTAPYQVELFTLDGKLAKSFNGLPYCSVNDLAPGAYLVAIRSGQSVETRKIIVQP